MSWVTFLLVFLPLAGALLVWLLPLPGNAAGGLALLVAFGEVALWILALVKFDFGHGGLQFEQHRTWFSDLNVSYHVGFYGFSLWLTGLTVVVLTAAIAYALWAGRGENKKQRQKARRETC